MIELIQSASLGRMELFAVCKMAALALCAILLFFFIPAKKQKKEWIVYGAISMLIAMIPICSAVYMVYQTRFYDYIWLWSVVPVMGLGAYGIAQYLPDFLKKKHKSVSALAMLILAAMLFFSYGSNADQLSKMETVEGKTYTKEVLDRIPASENTICLWAPSEIVQYSREVRPDISLFYGKNMWDLALNAYSYDAYSQEQTACYEWMEGLKVAKEETEESHEDVQNLSYAMEFGVNTILVPASVSEEDLQRIEEILDTKGTSLGDYYLFTL